MYFLICAIIFCICEIVSSNVAQYDGVYLLNSSHVPDYYNISQFRIAKFNRTAYGLNFNSELFTDIDEDYQVSTSFHYNRLNNQQYYKTIIRIPKVEFCRLMDKTYTTFLMKGLKDHSNLPIIKSPQKLCPFKKV